MAVGSVRGEDAEDEAGVEESVTAIGEPALVRATSIEIVRGSILAGRYQIEAVIGKGGSGIVLRAFDRVAQVPVAVKILKPDLATDPRWIERFSRELRLARQIQHPNVCRVFDIGQADGHWFITMELATAGTLRDQLGEQARQRSSEERVIDVRAVVAGLAAIHDAGIVHRDVKPDNFLRMQDGRLVLSDFGLATNPGEAPTVSIMVGTPFYMAPEVVMGEPATQQSDIWAAGVVIHEILLGTRPERTTPRRTKISVADAKATVVEKNLLRLTQPCLVEEIANRPQTAVTLLRLVDSVVTKVPRFGFGFGFGHLGARPTKQFWGALAIATLALTAAFSHRLWQPAGASSTSAAAPRLVQITTTGTPTDWSVGAKRLAEIGSRVHCFSLLPGRETARIVWGTPRRAEDIDLSTGRRTPSRLPAETFEVDCPQVSPDGTRLLFTRQASNTLPQIMLANIDATNSRMVTTGIEPLWMPSGEEFFFNIDASHAGIFSIPTMSYNLLDDERGRARRTLYKKAISTRGDLLAVMYNSDNMLNRVFELHSVPDLNVVSSWTMPFSIHDVSFTDRGLFLSDIDRGGSLERFEWRVGQADRIGQIPGRAIHSAQSLPGGTSIILSSTHYNDAWLFNPGEPPRQITHDGKTYSASWSPSGDLLLGRFLDDGRFVIVLRDATGSSKQVTEGPSDSLPSFSSDGSEWVYAAYDRQTIVRCKGTSCADLLRTQQIPIWPVLSPDLQAIAFVTGYGTPRLHIANASGLNERDVGPTAVECPPVWTDARSLWTFSGAGTNREWIELDAATGQRTGRSKSATTFNPDERACGWESEPPTSPFYQRVRVVPRETWDLTAQSTRLHGLD